MLAAVESAILSIAGTAEPGGSRLIFLLLVLSACLAITIYLPVIARKGKLHIPGYLFLALFSFIISIIFGKLSGSHYAAGTPGGIVLSVMFFLLIATSAGSILSLFLYRTANQGEDDI